MLYGIRLDTPKKRGADPTSVYARAYRRAVWETNKETKPKKGRRRTGIPLARHFASPHSHGLVYWKRAPKNHWGWAA